MRKTILLRTILILIVFMLGFTASNIYASINTEQPNNIDNTTTGNIKYTDEVPSPNDWVPDSDINVYSGEVILKIQDAQWATFTDTHSMEPVISSRANAIEIVPKTPDQIKVGDIVSYNSKYADGTIIHRVIQKSTDSEGIYFILKGDNNPTQDPGKIRFSQIKRVVVAIVY